MKNNNILIICNTHYQLLVAIQLKLSIYRDNNVDCVLSDIISGVNTIANRLKKENVFRNVFLAKAKGVDFKWNTDLVGGGFIDKELADSIKGDGYSEYLFANLGGIDLALGRLLMKNNSNIIVSMFEDGLSSYSRIFGSVIESATKGKGIKDIIRKFMVKYPFAKLDSYYVFCPEIMVWDCAEVKKIPPVKDNIEELRVIANNLYDFASLSDTYDEKIVFFEESYFQDGIKVNDISLVDSLAKEHGRSSILVKTHPRNEVNRFKNLGYKTNKDKAVPWEVIALNIDLDDKILVTMTSSALVNTYIMRPSDAKLIYDFRGIDILSNERLKYTVEVINKMKTVFTQLIIMEEEK